MVTLLLLWPWRWRLKKQPPLDENDLRRMRRFCDRVHADERLPHD